MRNLVVTLLIVIVVSFIGTIAFGQVEAIDKGTVILDSDQEDKYLLDGEWEFYWKKLLTPANLKQEKHEPSYLPVPQSWKKQMSHGEQLTNTGYGTYRVNLHIPESHVGTQKALSFYYIGSAYRIWVDGDEYDGIGTVGTSLEAETPLLQRNIIHFEPKERIVDIVI